MLFEHLIVKADPLYLKNCERWTNLRAGLFKDTRTLLKFAKLLQGEMQNSRGFNPIVSIPKEPDQYRSGGSFKLPRQEGH